MTLLVPTDFSPVSINAVNYAVALATTLKADILLAHIYQLPAPASEIPPVNFPYDDVKKAAENRLEDLKTHLIQNTAGTLNVLAEVRVGNIVDELAKICDAVKPFAVVMGTQGVTGLQALIIGSTALTAIRELPCPVMVIPGETSYKPIKKIGLACDFKDVPDSVPADFIRNIVLTLGAELHVLNVENYKGKPNKDLPLQSGYLETLLGNIVPTYHFLDAKDVTDGVINFALENHLDMILVIPKKHNLLESLFQKSETKRFLQQKSIPIVAAHNWTEKRN